MANRVIIFSPSLMSRAIGRSGLPKREVSRQLGHHTTTKLYRYLSGATTPTVDTLAKFATIVECDIDELFEVSE